MFKDFDAFKKWFETSTAWKRMASCKEDSPWHREESVAVHTNMVVDHARKLSDEAGLSLAATQLAQMSGLFHDVGKPAAKTEKYREDRGNYFAFHGHDLISARFIEDFYMSNRSFVKDMIPDHEALYKLMWIVENHIPYDIGVGAKNRGALIEAIVRNLGDDWEVFFVQLLADTLGRISDDAAEKIKATGDWIDTARVECREFDFDGEFYKPKNVYGDRHVIDFLVGASGSGKTTSREDLVAQGHHVYCFDDTRVALYKDKTSETWKNDIDLYAKAFDYCDTHRSEFGRAIDIELTNLLRRRVNIVVDNTNTSRKNRLKIVGQARRAGYAVRMHMFPISKDTLAARAESRTDKRLATSIVYDQYSRIQVPWLGYECDEMVIHPQG